MASERVNGRIIAGSVVTKLPSRCRCGHNSTAMTAPTTQSFGSPLAKFASACRENSRAKPASGEIRDNCGLTGSVAKHEAVLNDVAGKGGDATAARSGTPKAAATSNASVFISADQRRTVGRNLIGVGEQRRGTSLAGSTPSAPRTP